jgi:hypothetical protein
VFEETCFTIAVGRGFKSLWRLLTIKWKKKIYVSFQDVRNVKKDFSCLSLTKKMSLKSGSVQIAVTLSKKDNFNLEINETFLYSYTLFILKEEKWNKYLFN